MHPHLTPHKYILRSTDRIENTQNIIVVKTKNITYNKQECIADLSVSCGSLFLPSLPDEAATSSGGTPFLFLNFSMDILPYSYSQYKYKIRFSYFFIIIQLYDTKKLIKKYYILRFPAV